MLYRWARVTSIKVTLFAGGMGKSAGQVKPTQACQGIDWHFAESIPKTLRRWSEWQVLSAEEEFMFPTGSSAHK